MPARKKRRAVFKRGSAKKKGVGHRKLDVNTGSGHVHALSAGVGAKRNGHHLARKASAHEISRTVGLSSSQLSRAESLIARLEKQGRIEKF
jgi:hypothetical protein